MVMTSVLFELNLYSRWLRYFTLTLMTVRFKCSLIVSVDVDCLIDCLLLFNCAYFARFS